MSFTKWENFGGIKNLIFDLGGARGKSGFFGIFSVFKKCDRVFFTCDSLFLTGDKLFFY
jgi:hypothetical protein